MLTCTDMNYFWLWMKIGNENLTFLRQTMFQNRVRKTECLSDFVSGHTTECSAVHRFRRSGVQLNNGSDVQAFSCSDVQLFKRSDVQTFYQFIKRIIDNSTIQSYE